MRWNYGAFSRVVAPLFLAAAAFAVYWPSLSNEFVWDDTALVLRDPLIRSWRLIPEAFEHFLFLDATGSDFYRPLQRLSYMSDYALYGFEPWGYHLTNIFLHAMAGMLLFFFLQKFTDRIAVAFLASLAWVVHPVHSSAVAYISGRADLLAACFGFAALWLLLSRRPLLAAPLFLVALLSKESGAMFLVAGFLMLLARRDRPALRQCAVASLLALSLYCALRFSAEKRDPPPHAAVRPAARPILIARAWVEYAGLLVAPVNLHMERSLIASGAQVAANAGRREYQTLLGVILLAAFSLWIFQARQNQEFGLLLVFVAAYAPVSNVLSLNAHVAEHWLYVPSAFLLPAAAIFVARAAVKRALLMRLSVATLPLWIGFLCARTLVSNSAWSDQRTFVEHTISRGGGSNRMLINLANLELTEGNLSVAKRHFAAAQGDPRALFGLGVIELRQQNFAEAQSLFKKTAEHEVTHAESLAALGVVDYQQYGRPRTDFLQSAAAAAPHDWAIQRRYIAHMADSGHRAKAFSELRRFLKEQPFRSESWVLLAQLLAEEARYDLAFAAESIATAYDVRLERQKLGGKRTAVSKLSLH